MTSSQTGLHKILRLSDWWNFILPPILAFVYLFVLLFNCDVYDVMILVGLIILWMVGAASFGYFFNDVCDIKSDNSAGKKNNSTGLSGKTRFIIISGSLILATVPWLWITGEIFIWALVIVHLLLLVLYSAPPIRFKNNIFLGIICDALYSILVPLLIVFFAVWDMAAQGNNYVLPLIIIICWAFFKGIRNILLHQMNDRKNDRRAGQTSFVLRFGPYFTLNAINYIILPAEFILFFLLNLLVSKSIHNFYWGLLVFLIFTFLKFSLWKLFTRIPKRQFKKKFIYFMNDFYEEWMPVIALGFMMLSDWRFIILLLLHLLLFSKVVVHLFKDIKIIGSNLTENL